MRRIAVGWALFGTLLLVACEPSPGDLRARVAAAGVYSPRRVEVGNAALVELGQLLFFDAELSGNRDIACATCHLPSLHASDARHLSVGRDGQRLSRASVDLFNRGGLDAMFWDGRLRRERGTIVGPVALPSGLRSLLEAQALLPLLDRREMRGLAGDTARDGEPNELAAMDDADREAIWTAIVARLVAIPGYRERFAAAFPEVPTAEITIVHVARAIAAFESRLWELTDTSFDDYLGSVSEPGRDDAIDDLARQGAVLFFGDAGCARCHDGPLLSDGGFHDIGVPQIGPGRDEAHLDEGRFAVTHDPADRFAFRTPPLRNVWMTAPYMHDGAYDTLDAAVRHHLDPERSLTRYDGATLPADLAGQVHHEQDVAILANLDPDTRPLRPLSEDEISALLVFLGTLSSRTEQFLPPGAGAPRDVPSGLTVVSERVGGDDLP
ncbi:MAG: cytochrome c peroxidase [Sandaracinus sp.]